MTNKSQILFIIAALLAVMSEAFVSRPMLMHRAGTKLHLKATGMYLLYIYLYCHRYFCFSWWNAYILTHDYSLLALLISVPQKFSFSKQTTASRHVEYHTEDDDEEDIYHLRIVHFEHGKKSEEIDSRKYRNKSSSDGNRWKFGWDHREFMQSVEP